MKYIYDTPQWPHFSWDHEQVSDALVRVNKESGFLAGRLSSIGLDARMGAVVETVTHDIVSSSEIEGVVLNTDEVRSSVARRLGVDIPQSRDSSRYIDGIVDMMLDATVHYKEPLTHDRLFGWHNTLFPNGRSGLAVIDVARIEKEMDVFLDWFNAESTPKTYLKSAISHLWFVSIHPFDDGNGRIGRAIADMSLSQSDDSQMRYFSMSRQINAEKKSYYEILEHTQKQDGNITAWLLWYLDCMSRAIHASDELLSRVLCKAVFWQTHAGIPFSDREQQVLNVYLDGYEGKLTAKNWAKLSKVSLDTAARDIKHLVEAGILIPQPGRLRDVSYGIRYAKDSMVIPGPEQP
ncbi:MAG: Fic family protein [Bacteroidales bacterium]|nr:Fic family protein [Bacteroidales bacterium]